MKPFFTVPEAERVHSELRRYLEQGLIKTPEYLDLVGQPGTTPHEYFEDYVKEEKDLLKEHKSAFKQLIKSNGIRFPSDVTFPTFSARLEVFDSFKDLSTRVKILLHEYYQYKIGLKEREKEREKERKLFKELLAFVLSEAKSLID